MVVPQTPLHTARVLQEDRDHWDEVKVSALGLSLPAGAKVLEKGLQGDGYSEPGSLCPAPCLGHRLSVIVPVVQVWHTEHWLHSPPLLGGAPGSLPQKRGALGQGLSEGALAPSFGHNLFYNPHIWEGPQPGFRLSRGQV